MAEGSRYLVIINVATATTERFLQIVPGLKAVLERLSTVPVELAFRSADGDHFGYLLRSRSGPRQIMAAIESPNSHTASLSPGKHGWIEPFMRSADGIVVFEVGDTLAATQSFSRVGTWFQRH